MDSSEIVVPSSGIASVGFGDERDNQSSARIEKYYTRHTPEQIARLEEIFSENIHPDQGQRLIIAQELGLEPKQVKFWFQNKRTQKKAQKERVDNIVLRAENEKLKNENNVIRESLKNILCPSCGGPPGDNSNDHEHSRQQIQLENARLKDEYKKVCTLLQSYEPSYQPGLHDLNTEHLHDPSLGNVPNSGVENLCLDLTLGSSSYPNSNMMPKPSTSREEMKKASMLMVKLSRQMIKSFCENLNMSVKIDVPQSSTDENKSGVRISVRNSTDPAQPNGMILVATTSFWMPNTSQNLFQFFIDVEKRVKWDFLASGHPMKEIAQISTGTHHGSYLSIIQPLNSKGTLVIQECFADLLGSYVIYAPIKESDFNMLISNQDITSNVFLLPSGVTISEDGGSTENAARASSSSSRARGSRVTIAFQIVMPSPDVNFELVRAANTLITSTIKNIKEALNFCDME